MKKNYLTISKVNATRFDNALHTQFHQRLFEVVNRAELAKINVSADMIKAWKEGLELETEINRQSSLSEITKKIMAKDRQRDEVLTNFFGLIRMQCYSPIEATREAALRLSAVFRPYVGIQDESLERETALIRGIEKDVARVTNEVTVLGLSPVLAELHRLNEEYAQMQLHRHDDSQATKLPPAREARATTDSAFEVISQCILASYHLAQADDRKTVIALVEEINSISDSFRASHKETLSLKKAAEKKKDGGGGKKPEGGKKKPDDGSKKPNDGGGSEKKPDGGGTKKPEREEDPGEDQA